MYSVKKKNIYFIGVGGIGMSALAEYFSLLKKNVAGYDRTPSEITDSLIKKNIAVHFEDDPGLIPDPFREKSNTLIVYTPAIPEAHAELTFFRKQGFEILKRSEILGLIVKKYRCIAVAGTHGKTTVSSLIAHLFKQSALDCSAFLGGISKNYESNLLMSDTSRYMITEADEYDRSFLQLNPYFAVITAIDPDHLDIYGNMDEMKDSFRQFIRQILPNGKLLINRKIYLAASSLIDQNKFTYSLDAGSDYHAENIVLKDGQYTFDLVAGEKTIINLHLNLPGRVNIENAVAACAVALFFGISETDIRKSLLSFTGVKRRFDIQFRNEKTVYMDDYAHHPEEINALIHSIKEFFPGKKITGIFQPHLFSRTRDLMDGFTKSLEMLDELFLLDIYPARENPISGITSDVLLGKVKLRDKALATKQNILCQLEKKKFEILLTIGAGDIDTLVKPIREMLQHADENK